MPDLVVLEAQMPVLDGRATLALLREQTEKLPVILLSDNTERGGRLGWASRVPPICTCSGPSRPWPWWRRPTGSSTVPPVVGGVSASPLPGPPALAEVETATPGRRAEDRVIPRADVTDFTKKSVCGE